MVMWQSRDISSIQYTIQYTYHVQALRPRGAEPQAARRNRGWPGCTLQIPACAVVWRRRAACRMPECESPKSHFPHNVTLASPWRNPRPVVTACRPHPRSFPSPYPRHSFCPPPPRRVPASTHLSTRPRHMLTRPCAHSFRIA